jgi:hypothetical protein
MTPQEKMKAKLESLPIPAKEVRVYGSQIVVTTYTRDAAEKFAAVIAKFATVRSIIDSVDDLKDQKAAYTRRNDPGLVKEYFRQNVCRVFARI